MISSQALDRAGRLPAVFAIPQSDIGPDRHARLRQLLVQAHRCLDAAAETMTGTDAALDDVTAARLLLVTALTLAGVDTGLAQ